MSTELAAVSFRTESGVSVDVSWAAVDSGTLSSTVPSRTFRWYKGQKHYSGTYWSATTRGHVIYESRLGPREEHEHSEHSPLGTLPPDPAAASRRRKPRLALRTSVQAADLHEPIAKAQRAARMAEAEPVRLRCPLPDDERGRPTRRYQPCDPVTQINRPERDIGGPLLERRTRTSHESDPARHAGSPCLPTSSSLLSSQTRSAGHRRAVARPPVANRIGFLAVAAS